MADLEQMRAATTATTGTTMVVLKIVMLSLDSTLGVKLLQVLAAMECGRGLKCATMATIEIMTVAPVPASSNPASYASTPG
jgi:hypothetical protein